MSFYLTRTIRREKRNVILRLLLVVLLLNIITLSSISATSLVYDQATGKLDRFDVRNLSVPNKSNPSDYMNSAEVWHLDGYVGRLVYTGPPTTFTFTNAGLPAIGATNNRFYFILNNGTPNARTWREFFLVTRAKGLTHNGDHIDFSQVNTVIANCGGTYDLPVGAGSETVKEGEAGYNGAGAPGVNTNNSHPYRYPYKAIWIDVTQINTNQRTWNLTPTFGHYESRIGVNTDSGAMMTLNLGAQYLPGIWDDKPLIHVFNVDKIYITPIRFHEIQWRTDVQDGLEIANVRYFSTVDKAKVTISSDSAGVGTSFFFQAQNSSASFPFRLAYQCTLAPGAPPMPITSSRKSFDTIEVSVPSPIDGDSQKMHRSDGQILLYLDPGVEPRVADIYSSTIYVIVEKR